MGLEGSVLRNGRLHHSLDIGLVCYAPHLMCLFIVVATRIKISVLNILCKVFGMDANKQNSQMFQVYEMRFPGVQSDRNCSITVRGSTFIVSSQLARDK